MMRLWRVLLPELKQFPQAEQAGALRAARETNLETVELVGMAAGLVLVTAVTRYGLPDGSLASRTEAAVTNFVVAIPLLALVLAPFHVRRLRRGLRQQLHQRGRP
jgi:hypothetical protein